MAAYCGDEGAQEALGLWRCKECGCCCSVETRGCLQCPLAYWVRDLRHWGQAVQVRAAVAAARVALCEHEREGSLAFVQAMANRAHGKEMAFQQFHAPRRAIEAAEAWLAAPSDATQESWRRANVAAGYPFHSDWLPPAFNMDAVPREETLQRCARLAGEAPVREAIQSALIGWALA